MRMGKASFFIKVVYLLLCDFFHISIIQKFACNVNKKIGSGFLAFGDQHYWPAHSLRRISTTHEERAGRSLLGRCG
jgi:hypothetical protein